MLHNHDYDLMKFIYAGYWKTAKLTQHLRSQHSRYNFSQLLSEDWFRFAHSTKDLEDAVLGCGRNFKIGVCYCPSVRAKEKGLLRDGFSFMVGFCCRDGSQARAIEKKFIAHFKGHVSSRVRRLFLCDTVGGEGIGAGGTPYWVCAAFKKF